MHRNGSALMRGNLDVVLRRQRPSQMRARMLVLQKAIADCEEHFPWPALAESWRRDLETLRLLHAALARTDLQDEHD